MLALEKRHKIKNSQNRAIALTLFGICLTQKTQKKVSKVTRSISSTRKEGKERREKKIETFYRHDYQLNRLKSHSQSPVFAFLTNMRHNTRCMHI